VSQKPESDKVRKLKTPTRLYHCLLPLYLSGDTFYRKSSWLFVRWYCRYALSYRDLEEMMAERGIKVDHSTINRWVLKYAPELDKRIRPHLRSTNDSWRVDETYIKVKEQWTRRVIP